MHSLNDLMSFWLKELMKLTESHNSCRNKTKAGCAIVGHYHVAN